MRLAIVLAGHGNPRSGIAAEYVQKLQRRTCVSPQSSDSVALSTNGFWNPPPALRFGAEAQGGRRIPEAICAERHAVRALRRNTGTSLQFLHILSSNTRPWIPVTCQHNR